jgi:hypothetical protein
MKKKKKKTKITKKLLKSRVKNALKKREHIKTYRPSLPVVQSWFRTLNRALFNRRLIEPMIDVKRLVGDWGRCCADWDNRKCRKGTYDQNVIPYTQASIDYSLEIHCKFPSWKDFIETLAHEMVHLYQMQVIEDPYSNHNQNFYSFKSRFKTYGLTLHR